VAIKLLHPESLQGLSEFNQEVGNSSDDHSWREL
jgi:hypothetical protein